MLELTEQEHILALRQDTLSKITGCNNEYTRKLFDELYALYTGTAKKEKEIKVHCLETARDLENLKKTLEREIKENEGIHQRQGIDHSYAYNSIKRDIVKAYEIIYGEMKKPDNLGGFEEWDEHTKIRAINSIMAKRKSGVAKPAKKQTV